MSSSPPPLLILASTSRYRQALLARLGIPFTAHAPLCDEDALKEDLLSPRELAEKLALAKAQSLVATFPDAVILGSDQVCACEGQILHKPGDAAGAQRQLAALAGRKHQLITAVCLLHGGNVQRHTDITTLTMRSLTSAEIARYVAVDEPYDCAGAYKLEQQGIALFDAIESLDHTAIVGLPLIAVASLLRGVGFATP
ncbi:MAG TPA: nucleoside triphosphate pyrophosphatase [Pirellulaceae bacterium]|nr:nucleoside triphosphate pyrophosphatase [Pirellulaceae bacterium]